MAVKNNKKRVMVTLSDPVFKLLEEMSSDRGLTKSVIVSLALEELNDKEKAKKYTKPLTDSVCFLAKVNYIWLKKINQ